jgi:transposase
MKFVATKTADQLDLQALHRVRERMVSQRTGIINQIRAFLLERGVAVRQGPPFLRAELPGILATRTDALSPSIDPCLLSLIATSLRSVAARCRFDDDRAHHVGV